MDDKDFRSLPFTDTNQLIIVPPQNNFLIMAKDEIGYQCLTDEQLLDETARLLRILEQRLERKQTLCNQKVQSLMSEREKLKTINTIVDQLQDLVSSGNALGFVFGLVMENKTWSTSSDNLSRWWNKNVKFERHGPRVLASEISESFELEALKNLQDTTLSSIISVLMPHCRPAQRSAPFHGEKPVAWWPKGTEEWWGRVKLLKDSGPPEYKKPHSLRKNEKLAVLIAIIKNFEPNFSRIHSLVSDTQTLQSKMNHREKKIWLAVIKGEEIRMCLHPDYQRCSNANILGNSTIESNSCYIAGKNVKVNKADCRSIGDKLVDIINSPSSENGENKSENKKKIVAGKEQVTNTRSSSAPTRSQGSLSKATKEDKHEAANDRNNLNEELNAYPEVIQVSKNIFPIFSQSSLLVKKDTASKSENTKKQKLMGIVNPDRKRLKLPYWNCACRWSSHDMQGTVHDSNQEYQVQTNNFDANLSSISTNKFNPSKNKTGQSYDSLTSSLAPVRGQVIACSSNSLIPHDQSMNQYITEKGSVSMDNQIQNNSQTIYGSPNITSLSLTGDHPSVESSFQPNTSVAESYKVEKYEANKMERSAFTEPGAVDKSPNSTLMQGSVDNKTLDFQCQTNNNTLYPSSISANNFHLGENINYQPIASYLMPNRGEKTNFNSTDTVKSLNNSNTASQSSTNLNPQIQHQSPLNSTEQGSVNINPQSQDQLKLVSKNQGSRDSKPQFQNQFESGSSSHPVLESSHIQITNSKRLSNSLISDEQGINCCEDLESGKNNDIEKTKDIENATDSDAAAESRLLNFEFDDLAVELNAFCALDLFNSNNLDGIFSDIM